MQNLSAASGAVAGAGGVSLLSAGAIPPSELQAVRSSGASEDASSSSATAMQWKPLSAAPEQPPPCPLSVGFEGQGLAASEFREGQVGSPGLAPASPQPLPSPLSCLFPSAAALFREFVDNAERFALATPGEEAEAAAETVQEAASCAASASESFSLSEERSSERLELARKCTAALSEVNVAAESDASNTEVAAAAAEAAALLLPALLELLGKVALGSREGEPHSFRQQLLLLLRLVASRAAAPFALSRQQEELLPPEEQRRLREAHEALLPKVWNGCLDAICGDCEECAVRSLASLIHLRRHPKLQPAAAGVGRAFQTHQQTSSACGGEATSDQSGDRVASLGRAAEAPLPAAFASGSGDSQTSRAPVPSIDALAESFVVSTVPQVYGPLVEAIEAQVKTFKEKDILPSPGDLPLGRPDRLCGQLVPSKFSVRVAGDIAYTAIAMAAQHSTEHVSDSALEASLDLLVRLLSLDIPEAFSSDPATQEASRDFHMAQSRVLLYVCYLLKNACNEPSGSSEQLPTQGGTHESVMGRFAAKALKELPHSIVRLLRALRPPLLLKRKTVHESLKLLACSRFSSVWVALAESLVYRELALFNENSDAALLKVYTICHLHDILLMFPTPAFISFPLLMRVIRWGAHLLLDTKPHPSGGAVAAAAAAASAAASAFGNREREKSSDSQGEEGLLGKAVAAAAAVAATPFAREELGVSPDEGGGASEADNRGGASWSAAPGSAAAADLLASLSTHHLTIKLLHFTSDLAVRKYSEAVASATKDSEKRSAPGTSGLAEGNAKAAGGGGGAVSEVAKAETLSPPGSSAAVVEGEDATGGVCAASSAASVSPPNLAYTREQCEGVLLLCLRIICTSLISLRATIPLLHSAAVSEGTEEFDGTESGLAGASSRLDSSRGATPNFFPPVVDFPGAQAAMASAGPRQQQQYRLLLRELKSLLRSTCIALRCVVYHVVVLPLQPLPSPKHSSSHPHPQPSAAQEGDGGLSAAPPSTSRSSRGAEVAGAASSSRRASFDVRLLPRGQQLAPADLEFLSEAFFATVGCALGHAKCVAFASTWRLQHEIAEGGAGCVVTSAPVVAPSPGTTLFRGLTENPIVYALNVAQLEERELLELTASTVAFLHPADLATFAAWGVASFHCLLEHYPQCVALLQFFLGHSHTSKIFGSALLEYVTPRIALLRERRAALFPPPLPARQIFLPCAADARRASKQRDLPTSQSGTDQRRIEDVMREVYGQFDGVSVLSTQTQASDWLMLPLEIQVPVAGQGVRCSVPFPHISAQLVGPSQAPDAAANCSRHAWQRLCAADGREEPRERKTHSVSAKNPAAANEGLSQHLLFAADIFDQPQYLTFQDAFLVVDPALDAAILRGASALPSSQSQALLAQKDKEMANASTILQLPGVCSSSGSSSVSPLPPDFADCAAAAAFSELHPRLSTQRGVGLLLLERPHTFVFPSNSRPQYYGRKEACCCCRCVEIARAGKAKESVASEREASFDEHLKQGCCCGRCFVCVPTPTRHAAATACAVRMLRRMLKLRGVPDAASLETNSQMDVDEEEARGVSGLGMVEGEKDAEWSFPSFPVDSAEGSSCRDTADICPGEEGLLQTSTGFCRMSQVATLVRLFRYLLKAVVACRQCEALLAFPYLQQICRSSVWLASRSNFSHVLLGLLRVFLQQITPPGRSAHFYAAFLPLVQSFLQTCAQQQLAAPDVLKDLWIEFSLLTPARLKDLLAHLNYFVFPMLRGLEGTDADLTTLALRSAELWVEHLHADFLYPILASQSQQGAKLQRRTPLLAALLQLLQPLPPPAPSSSLLLSRYFITSNGGRTTAGSGNHALQHQQHEKHSEMAIKILGKLGGNNRAFLKDAALLSPETTFQPALIVGLPLGSPVSQEKGRAFAARGSADNRLLNAVPVSVRAGSVRSAAEEANLHAPPGSDEWLAPAARESVLELGVDKVVELVLQLLQQADADHAAASLCFASEPLLTTLASRISVHPLQRTQLTNAERLARRRRSRLSAAVRSLQEALASVRRQAVSGGEAIKEAAGEGERDPDSRRENSALPEEPPKLSASEEPPSVSVVGAAKKFEVACRGKFAAAEEELAAGAQLLQGLTAVDGAAAPGLCLSLCESCVAADLRASAGQLLIHVLLLLLNFDSPLSLYWLLLVTRASSAYQRPPQQVLIETKSSPSEAGEGGRSSRAGLVFSAASNVALPSAVAAALLRQTPNFAADRAVPAAVAEMQSSLLQQLQHPQDEQLWQSVTAAAVAYRVDRHRAALRTEAQREAEQLLLERLLKALLILACDDAVFESRQKQLQTLRGQTRPLEAPSESECLDTSWRAKSSRSSSRCTAFVDGLFQHCALIFASRVAPPSAAPLVASAALHELDAECLVRALTNCLRIEASSLLPSLHAIRALELCCKTFISIQPGCVRSGCSSSLLMLCSVSLVRCCFSSSSHRRAAGALALIRLLRVLPPLWARIHFWRVAQAALNCIKAAQGTDARLCVSLGEELLLLLFSMVLLGYRGSVKAPNLLAIADLMRREAVEDSGANSGEVCKYAMRRQPLLQEEDSPFLRSVLAGAEAEHAQASESSGSEEGCSAKPSWQLPPPVPEDFPLSLSERRTAYGDGVWWLKRSEFATLPLLKGQEALASGGTAECLDGYFQSQGSAAVAASACESAAHEEEPSRLLRRVWRFLDLHLLPAIFHQSDLCRQSAQRLLLLLPLILGCSTVHLLSFSSVAAAAASLDAPNGEAVLLRGVGEDPHRQLPSWDSAAARGGASPSAEGNAAPQGLSTSTDSPGSAGGGASFPLLRVLRWVTLRHLRLLPPELQSALLCCCCFLAGLRPAPRGLRPDSAAVAALEIVAAANASAAAASGVGSGSPQESVEGSRDRDAGKEAEVGVSVAEEDGGATKEGPPSSDSPCDSSAALKTAAADDSVTVVAWLLEDALELLQKGADSLAGPSVGGASRGAKTPAQSGEHSSDGSSLNATFGEKATGEQNAAARKEEREAASAAPWTSFRLERDSSCALLLALRFVKLALLHEDWRAVVRLPRSALRGLLSLCSKDAPVAAAGNLGGGNGAEATAASAGSQALNPPDSTFATVFENAVVALADFLFVPFEDLSRAAMHALKVLLRHEQNGRSNEAGAAVAATLLRLVCPEVESKLQAAVSATTDFAAGGLAAAGSAAARRVGCALSAEERQHVGIVQGTLRLFSILPESATPAIQALLKQLLRQSFAVAVFESLFLHGAGGAAGGSGVGVSVLQTTSPEGVGGSSHAKVWRLAPSCLAALSFLPEFEDLGELLQELLLPAQEDAASCNAQDAHKTLLRRTSLLLSPAFAVPLSALLNRFPQTAADGLLLPLFKEQTPHTIEQRRQEALLGVLLQQLQFHSARPLRLALLRHLPTFKAVLERERSSSAAGTSRKATRFAADSTIRVCFALQQLHPELLFADFLISSQMQEQALAEQKQKQQSGGAGSSQTSSALSPSLQPLAEFVWQLLVCWAETSGLEAKATEEAAAAAAAAAASVAEQRGVCIGAAASAAAWAAAEEFQLAQADREEVLQLARLLVGFLHFCLHRSLQGKTDAYLLGFLREQAQWLKEEKEAEGRICPPSFDATAEERPMEAASFSQLVERQQLVLNQATLFAATALVRSCSIGSTTARYHFVPAFVQRQILPQLQLPQKQRLLMTCFAEIEAAGKAAAETGGNSKPVKALQLSTLLTLLVKPILRELLKPVDKSGGAALGGTAGASRSHGSRRLGVLSEADANLLLDLLATAVRRLDASLQRHDALSIAFLEVLREALPLLPHNAEARRDLFKFVWQRKTRSASISVQHTALLLLAEFCAGLSLEQQRLPELLLRHLFSWQAAPRPLLLRRASALLLPLYLQLPASPNLPLLLPSTCGGGVRSATVPLWVKLLVRAAADIPLLHFVKLVQQHEALLFPSRRALLQLLLGAADQLLPAEGKAAASSGGKADNRRHVLDILELLLRWERRATLLLLLKKSRFEDETLKGEDAAAKKRRLSSGAATTDSKGCQRPATDKGQQARGELLRELAAADALCMQRTNSLSSDTDADAAEVQLSVLRSLGDHVYYRSLAVAEQQRQSLDAQMQQADWRWTTKDCRHVVSLLLSCLTCGVRDSAAAAASASALPLLALLMQLHPNTPLPLARLCDQRGASEPPFGQTASSLAETPAQQQVLVQEQQELHQQTQQRQQLALAAAHVAVEQQGVSCLCASCAASSQAAEAASPDSEAKSPVASSAPLCGWKQTLPQLLFLIGSCCGSCPRVCSSLQVLVAKLVMLHRPSTALLCAVSGGARAFSAWRQQQAVQTPSAAAAASSGTAGGVWWSDAPPPLLSPEDLLYERLLAAACTGLVSLRTPKSRLLLLNDAQQQSECLGVQISLPAAAAIIRGLCVGLSAAAEETGRSKAEAFLFLRLLLPLMHEAAVDVAQTLAVPQKRNRLQALEAQTSQAPLIRTFLFLSTLISTTAHLLLGAAGDAAAASVAASARERSTQPSCAAALAAVGAAPFDASAEAASLLRSLRTACTSAASSQHHPLALACINAVARLALGPRLFLQEALNKEEESGEAALLCGCCRRRGRALRTASRLTKVEGAVWASCRSGAGSSGSQGHFSRDASVAQEVRQLRREWQTAFPGEFASRAASGEGRHRRSTARAGDVELFAELETWEEETSGDEEALAAEDEALAALAAKSASEAKTEVAGLEGASSSKRKLGGADSLDKTEQESQPRVQEAAAGEAGGTGTADLQKGAERDLFLASLSPEPRVPHMEVQRTKQERLHSDEELLWSVFWRAAPRKSQLQRQSRMQNLPSFFSALRSLGAYEAPTAFRCSHVTRQAQPPSADLQEGRGVVEKGTFADAAGFCCCFSSTTPVKGASETVGAEELGRGVFTTEELQLLLGQLTATANHRRPEVSLFLHWAAVRFACAPLPMARDAKAVSHRNLALLQSAETEFGEGATTTTEAERESVVGASAETTPAAALTFLCGELLPVPMLQALLQATQSPVSSIRRAALLLLDVQLTLQHQVQQLYRQQEAGSACLEPLKPITCIERLQLLLLMPHWGVIASRNLLQTLVALMVMRRPSARGSNRVGCWSVFDLLQQPQEAPRALLRDAGAPLLPPLVPQQQHLSQLSSMCELSTLNFILRQRRTGPAAADGGDGASGESALLSQAVASYARLVSESSEAGLVAGLRSEQRRRDGADSSGRSSSEALDLLLRLEGVLSTPGFAEWREALECCLQRQAAFFAEFLIPAEEDRRASDGDARGREKGTEESSLSQLTDGESFAESLEHLAFFSSPLAELLLAQVLKSVWNAAAALTSASAEVSLQQQLTDAFAAFLARDFEAEGCQESGAGGAVGGSSSEAVVQGQQQSRRSPLNNASRRVLRPFLAALLQLEPLPLLPAELLQHLALEHACAHEALQLLQHVYLHSLTHLPNYANAAALPQGLAGSSPEEAAAALAQQSGAGPAEAVDDFPQETLLVCSRRPPEDDVFDREDEASVVVSQPLAPASAEKNGQGPSAASPLQQQQYYAALARKAAAFMSEVYGQLEETDCRVGVIASRSSCAQTTTALSLLQHAQYGAAKSLLVSTLKVVHSQSVQIETEEQREEVTWWERLWIDCCKELNRWNSLHELEVAAASRSKLSLQCASKLQHWAVIEKLLHTHKVADPATKLCQEIDIHSSEVQRLLLQSWRALPSIPTDAHVPLLVQFQLYVELLEGYNLILHLANKINNPGEVPLVRTTLNSWRDRLPNKCDTIGCWNDLFVWRNFVFSIVQNAVAAAPQLTHAERSSWAAYMQDLPWTMLKFAAVTRSAHRLRDISLALLMKLQALPTFSQPAYAQEHLMAFVEKVKLCLDEPSHWVAGLQLVNSLNLESLCTVPSQHSGPQQQLLQQQLQLQSLQLLRLKATLLHKLYGANLPQQHLEYSREDLANEAESVLRTVLLLQPLYGPAWLSWGKLHDTLFMEALKKHKAQKAHQQQRKLQSGSSSTSEPLAAVQSNPSAGEATVSASSGGTEAASSGDGNSDPQEKGVYENLQLHLAAAVMGYLMDIQLRPSKSFLYMTRVLWLLSYDGDTKPPLPSTSHSERASSNGDCNGAQDSSLNAERQSVANGTSFSSEEGTTAATFAPKGGNASTASPAPSAAAANERSLCLRVFGQIASKCTQPQLLLPWVPQFLTGLDRPEAPEVERLLCALLIQVPQQLYFDVRTAYLEKREQVAQKQSVQTGRGTLDSQPQQQSLALLSRLMTVFRTSFTPQCMALDHLAEEVVATAKPSTVDEILCAIRTLLQQCVEMPYNHTVLPAVAAQFLRLNVVSRFKARYGTDAEQQDPAKSAEGSVSSAASKNKRKSNRGSCSCAGAAEESARRTMRSLWPLFKRDFDFAVSSEGSAGGKGGEGASGGAPKSAASPAASLSDVIVKLKRWKDLLASRVRSCEQRASLDDVGAALCDVFNRVSVRIEVPGLALVQLTDLAAAGGGCGEQRQPVYIHHFGTSHASVTRSHYTLKRLDIYGSNGSRYCFLVQPYSTAHQRTEQRVLCLLILLNRLLLRWKGTRSRGLNFAVGAQASIHPRCRLLEDSPHQVSLQQILNEVSAHASGDFRIDPDLPVLLHRQLKKARTSFHTLAQLSMLLAPDSPQRQQLPFSCVGTDGQLRLPEALVAHITAEGFCCDDEQRQMLKEILQRLGRTGPASEPAEAEPAASVSGGGKAVLQTETPAEADVSRSQTEAPQQADAAQQQQEQRWMAEFQRNCQLRASIEVYEHLCNLVPDQVLRVYVHRRLRSAEELFLFKRQFTQGHAIYSVLNHIFSMADINPSKILLDMETGQVSQLELKASYCPASLTLNFAEKLPFRLTRNIELLMDAFGRCGIFPGCMYELICCLQKFSGHFANAAALLIRDDVTFLHKQKQHHQQQQRALQHSASATAGAPGSASAGETSSHSAEAAEAVRRVVEMNVSRVLDVVKRLHGAPRNQQEAREDVPIDSQVSVLMSIASRQDLLALAKPTWQAWF